MPHYPQNNGMVKVPAGWLIEECGLKGHRKGDVGTYDKQALVIVNHGNASAQDIYSFSSLIIKTVDQNFGIQLEREVNVW